MANLSMTMDDEYLTTKALAILQIKPQKFQILYESGHYAKVILIIFLFEQRVLNFGLKVFFYGSYS